LGKGGLPLSLTLEWKRLLGREKDRADIAALERWSS